jgi:hypothetical protein
MPLAEMQEKAAYIRPKVVGAFPGSCASGSYVHRAALFNVSKNKYGPYYTRCHESIIKKKIVMNPYRPAARIPIHQLPGPLQIASAHLNKYFHCYHCTENGTAQKRANMSEDKLHQFVMVTSKTEDRQQQKPSEAEE